MGTNRLVRRHFNASDKPYILKRQHFPAVNWQNFSASAALTGCQTPCNIHCSAPASASSTEWTRPTKCDVGVMIRDAVTVM